MGLANAPVEQYSKQCAIVVQLSHNCMDLVPLCGTVGALDCLVGASDVSFVVFVLAAGVVLMLLAILYLCIQFL